MIKIVEKQTTDLIPYENNARINDDAVEFVANSIKEFGFKNPIIIDNNNVIIAGHTRLKAAEKLGIKKVPCIIADDLTDEQIKAFRIADNSTAQIAEWDMAKLQAELDAIDFDMSSFGLQEQMDEIEKLIENEKEITEDEVPEVDEENEPTCKLGDIWQLGEHRLMCGDSTDKATVEMLMNGKKADMIFTDPPYNVDYEGKGKERLKIQNDSFATDEECAKRLWLPAFENMQSVANDCCAYYCCMPQGGTHMMMMMMMMKAGWQVKHELIWKKQSIVLNRADYNYQHEPILYGWNKTHKFYGKGKFYTTSVWEFDRPTKSKEHPTMKPIALIVEALDNSSKKRDIVLDLFGGSGSTLIACEQNNRICYMMELDPKYCDVIIKRWENLTGKKAIKL